MYVQENTELLESQMHYYEISWRLNMLIVRPAGEKLTRGFALFKGDKQQIIDCLMRSPVRKVKLDPELANADLLLWADACHSAKKMAFLRLPRDKFSKRRNNSFLLALAQVCNAFFAFVLLILLSPLMLVISIKKACTSSHKLFERTWRVGYRGELFLDFKFYSDYQQGGMPNMLPRQKIERYLIKFPQLLNVIMGKIKLFGSQSVSLEKISSLDPGLISNLNICPGILGNRSIANIDISLNEKVVV